MAQRLKALLKRLLRMQVPLSVHIDRDLLIKFVAKCLSPEAVYVEVGAFTGLQGKWFCEMASLRPEHCHLIEAEPTNHSLMVQNCVGFRLYNFAISNTTGSVPFYVVDNPRDEGTSRSNSFDREHLERRYSKDNVREVMVSSIDMNSFFARYGLAKVDFLFFNCEGAEYRIFDGDISFLSRVRFLYLDLHHRDGNIRALKQQQLRIYDRVTGAGFVRLGGHLREHIPHCPEHLSFLWERSEAP